MESSALIKHIRTLINRIAYVEAEISEGDITCDYSKSLRNDIQSELYQVADDIENPGLKVLRDLITSATSYGYDVSKIQSRVKSLKNKG